jgi:hypothetical protein
MCLVANLLNQMQSRRGGWKTDRLRLPGQIETLATGPTSLPFRYAD